MILTSYSQECICGRSFGDTGAFTRHKKTCLKGKKHLAHILSHARESYHSKKCCIEDEESASSSQIVTPKAVSHHDTVDDTLGNTVLEVLNTLGSMDTIQPRQTKVSNEAHVSRVDQVCILFLIGFI